jgi:hypothetical protein
MADSEADDFRWSYPVKGFVHALEKEIAKVLGSGPGGDVADVDKTRGGRARWRRASVDRKIVSAGMETPIIHDAGKIRIESRKRRRDWRSSVLLLLLLSTEYVGTHRLWAGRRRRGKLLPFEIGDLGTHRLGSRRWRNGSLLGTTPHPRT